MNKLIAVLVLLLIIAVIFWGITPEYDNCYSAMKYEGHASMGCCCCGKCGGISATEYLSETCCSCPHLVLGCHPVKENKNGIKDKTITIRTIDNEDFKQQILHLGKSQRQIANELGISEPMLSRWMNGKTIIPEDKIDLLSEYIDKNSKEMYEFWKEKIDD